MSKSRPAIKISHINVVDYQRPIPGCPSPLIFYCHLPDGFYTLGGHQKRRFHPSEIGRMVEAGTLYPLSAEIPYRKGDIVLITINENIVVRRLKNPIPGARGEIVDVLP